MVAIAHLAAQEVAPAVYAGTQRGFDDVPDIVLYNLTAAIVGHPEGSTVSAETLLAAGYRLPRQDIPARLPVHSECPVALVFREVIAHPRGGYTHALPVDATQSSVRIYRGWWSSRVAAELALETLFS